MVTQYDTIASEYKQVLETLLREYVHDSTFNFLVDGYLSKADLHNCSAIDFGCGEGRYTRMLKRKGIPKVIGIDTSDKMIKMAIDQEYKTRLGLEYFISDSDCRKKWGSFDISTAWFLLHYADSKQHLFDICSTVCENLKNNGIFIAYQSNPFSPQARESFEYGEYRRVIGEEKEGADIEVFLIKNKHKVNFIRKYWKAQTYFNALHKAGFSEIKIVNPIISDQGIKLMGPSFWQKYIQEPSQIAYVCRK